MITVIFYLSIIIGLTLLFFFVDRDDKSYLAIVRFLVFEKLPRFIRNTLNRIGLGKLCDIADWLWHYLLFTNHPLVQIFYLVIVVGGFSYYWYYGLLKYVDGVLLSKYHWVTAFTTIFLSLWSYYKVCSVGPG